MAKLTKNVCFFSVALGNPVEANEDGNSFSNYLITKEWIVDETWSFETIRQKNAEIITAKTQN